MPMGLTGKSDEDPEIASFRRETHDMRWVSCRRPFVVAGGELTLEMLDLRYDEGGHYYEAPLHMKALGGCFLIDDFGRQFVSPRDLLNRWIVPMESRVDYLKLQHRRQFQHPLRRNRDLRHKPGSGRPDGSGVSAPSSLQDRSWPGPGLDQFRTIFDNVAKLHGMELTDDVFKFMVYMITAGEGS